MPNIKLSGCLKQRHLMTNNVNSNVLTWLGSFSKRISLSRCMSDFDYYIDGLCTCVFWYKKMLSYCLWLWKQSHWISMYMMWFIHIDNSCVLQRSHSKLRLIQANESLWRKKKRSALIEYMKDEILNIRGNAWAFVLFVIDTDIEREQDRVPG